MRFLEKSIPVAVAVFSVTCFLTPVSSLAQSAHSGLGRAPSADEIRTADISISPTGKELPPGRGTSAQGEKIFAEKCAACHGEKGVGGQASTLISRNAPKYGEKHVAVVEMGFMGGMQRVQEILARDTPYATVIWDKINRGMPLDIKGLTPDEVYALVAYLLDKNGLIPANQVMNAQTLPKVKMPMPKYSSPDWKPGTPRLVGYPGQPGHEGH